MTTHTQKDNTNPNTNPNPNPSPNPDPHPEQEASVLAKKFFTLYALLGDLLSPQLHYDWGLRAIKSVLVQAGSSPEPQP